MFKDLALVIFSREYRIPVLVTVVLHAILLFWLAADFTHVDESVKHKPKFIKANLVSIKDSSKKKAIKKPVAKKKLVKKKVQKPKPKPKKLKPIKKPTQVKKQQATPKVDEKAVALKKKKAQEKKQGEKDRLEKEKKLKAEQERLKKEQERKLREQALMEDALMEEAYEEELETERQEEAQRQATEDEQTALSYMAAIQAAVKSNWSRPPSARNGMQVTLQIELVPTGAVVAVNVIKGSGNAAFDRAAVDAVWKTERFVELVGLESRIFRQYYRRFKLLFNPEDLRL